MISESNKSYINIGGIASAVDEEGNVWLSDIYNERLDGLYKCNKESECFELVINFEGKVNLAHAKHGNMVIVNDCVILFPIYDDRIIVYNIKHNDYKTIALDMRKSNAFNSVQMNDTVWIISNTGEDVYKFDLNANSVEKDTELSKVLRESNITTVGDMDALVEHNKISFYSNGWVILLDPEKHTIDKIRINFEEDKIKTVRYAGNRFWILFKRSFDVYSVDYESGEYNKIACKNGELWNNDLFPYERVYEYNGEIIFLNAYSKKIMHVNNNEICPLFEDINIELSQNVFWGGVYTGLLPWKQGVFFVPAMGSSVLKCDKDLKLEKCIGAKACLSVSDKTKAMKSIIENTNNDVLYENNELESLQGLIGALK